MAPSTLTSGGRMRRRLRIHDRAIVPLRASGIFPSCRRRTRSFCSGAAGSWGMLPGIPLCLSWRTGGNLLVPAAAHAALDGVRNALLLMK